MRTHGTAGSEEVKFARASATNTASAIWSEATEEIANAVFGEMEVIDNEGGTLWRDQGLSR